MKVLSLCFIFISNVFAENTFSQHHFQRQNALDSFKAKEAPSDVRQTKSRLQCSVLCSQDDQCAAVTYYDGQCFRYSSSVSDSGISLPGATTFNKEAGGCPESQGYTLVQSLQLCYKLYTNPWLNWRDSQTRCESDGGRLIILNTEQKHDYIGDLMTRTSSTYGALVGLEVYSETSYAWTDGSTFIRSGGTSSPFYKGYKACAYMHKATLKTTVYTNAGWSLCEVVL
ncbi:uncharacterized protein LOC124284275 [Haliotis rubra]|uniref:uncharacterized protein LOC124284275 n=1 Tax=Haliotis rubra TaxID=36100 RepID=UPI001EE5764D|nr:uncharacterized protein LOC124284275 [Haliotis rubra]